MWSCSLTFGLESCHEGRHRKIIHTMIKRDTKLKPRKDAEILLT